MNEKDEPKVIKNVFLSPSADGEPLSDVVKGQLKATMEGFGFVAHGTVKSVKELAVSIEPSIQDDVDHLVAQLRELEKYSYLRAVASDPYKFCDGIGIQYGKVEPVTITALALGVLDERHKDADKSSRWWFMVGGVALAVVGRLIYDALMGG